MTPDKLFQAIERYAHKQGFELNADKEHVMMLMEGLLANETRYGYRSCPCRLAKDNKDADRDIVCPCVYREPDIVEFGSCYCGLYVSSEWNSNKMKHIAIPERRPIDMR